MGIGTGGLLTAIERDMLGWLGDVVDDVVATFVMLFV